ncbi:hypothetical protein CO612_07350 [Lysobacteraceae bacterium NML71-0210]|nr:hypothetical protein CO612_07350 [Xanthomonadaceae bacterium NML71-0210]
MHQLDLFTGETDAMSVKRRADSGAWQVSVGQHRKSDRNWSLADALRYEASLLQPNDEHTLEEALDRWLNEYTPFLRAEENYRRKAEKLRPLLKHQPLHNASEVAHQAKREWRGLRPATINRHLQILKRITKLAFEEWGWLSEPVWRKIKLLPERNERHVYLTREEVDRLAAACRSQDAADLVIFAAYTGLRRGEMFNVRCTDVRNNVLYLSAQTKTGKPRHIPLHPRALEVALRLPLDITPAVLQNQWTEARETCGMQHVHWHDLRHTFASWLVQQDTPLLIVKQLMGHATVKMTERYAHLAPTQAHQEVLKL